MAALVSPLGIVGSSLCTRVSSPNAAGDSCGLVARGSPSGAVSPTSTFGPCGRAEPAGSVSPVAIALLALQPCTAGRGGHIAGGSVMDRL